jgi:hypothetical protein
MGTGESLEIFASLNLHKCTRNWQKEFRFEAVKSEWCVKYFLQLNYFSQILKLVKRKKQVY